MKEVRVILSQCGAAIELHSDKHAPITLGLFKPTHLEQYRAKLANQNPDMRHASIGQLAMGVAKEVVRHDCTLNPHLWEYNATTNEYTRL